jgi:TonB family protein
MKSPVVAPPPASPAPPPPVLAEPPEATILMNASPLVSVPGEATVLMSVPPTPPPASVARPKSGSPKDRTRPLVPDTASAAAPVMKPARSGVPAGLIIGGGLAAVLVATAALGFVLWRSRGASSAEPTAAPTAEARVTTAPSPTAATAATRGSLRIESQPPGAIVQVNGQTKGPTPLEFGDLPLGTYEVKIELKGYEPKLQALNLTEAEPRGEVKAALNRLAAALLPADLVSNPEGASVLIDGARSGITPLSGFKLKPGSHQVELTKEGFEPWTGSLTVQAGKPARLEAQLKAMVKATPVPTPAALAVDANKIYTNSTSDAEAPVDVIAKKMSGPSVGFTPRLKSGESVSVTMTFIIDEEGTVSDVRVVESGGKQLDEAAVAAVLKWKYSPATKQGVKVKVRHTFRQTYRAG